MKGAAAIRLVLCERTEHHARQIMAWRNDPETRATSFHRDEKIWETFWPEFLDTYFPAGVCPGPAIVEADGVAVGFLRFRPLSYPDITDGATCDISIVLDPSARGFGFGPRALEAAKTLLMKSGIAAAIAEVRVGNDASKRIFIKAGFEHLGTIDKLVPDTGEKCRIDTFLACLQPQNGSA